MIILGKYNELSPNKGYPSMKDHFENDQYYGKAEILEYLLNGRIHMVTASHITDVFTGETIGKELVYMDDGEFSWSSKIPYYVDKYNLRLPEEFENHVLN